MNLIELINKAKQIEKIGKVDVNRWHVESGAVSQKENGSVHHSSEKGGG